MLSSLPPWRRKLNQEPVARGRVAGLLQGGIPVPGPTSTLGCGWDSPSHSGRPELVSLASKPQHRPFLGPRHLLFFFALQILPRSSRLLLPRPLPSPWPPDSTHMPALVTLAASGSQRVRFVHTSVGSQLASLGVVVVTTLPPALFWTQCSSFA